MKRILSILVLVVAVSFQTNAQERKRQHRQGQHLTAEQVATLGSKKMTLKLDLADSQEKQVYQLLKLQAEDRINMRAKQQEMKANNEKPTEEDRYNFQVAQLDKQIAFKKGMKKVLNEAQYEQWSKTLGRRNHENARKGPQKGKRNNGNRSK